MNKQQLLKPFHDLKKEIEGLKKNKSLHRLVEKFHVEKKSLEKKIEKTVYDEIKKARKFLDEQKRELNTVQKKVEAIMKKNIKKGTKKVAQKKATKKVAPKVAKATKKVTKR